MGKMPDALRETIARNIRDCRMNKFPGRGGGKRCAESFGVSPQQWSPWESGKRTPDELRLEQIAIFFDTTVEWFRRDHRQDMTTAMAAGNGRANVLYTHVLGGELAKDRSALLADGEEDDINHYVWALGMLTRKLTAGGVRVVVSFERAADVVSA